MRRLNACVPFLVAIALAAKDPVTTKVAMHAVTHESWVMMVGTWEADGRPKILDLSYTPRWNPTAFSETISGDYHLVFKDMNGKEGSPRAVQVARTSDGKGRMWTSHLGYFSQYVGGFTITGPDVKALPGYLPLDGPGSPSLRIQESRGSIQWDVKDAWQVQVVVSLDEGETWRILGDKPAGTAKLDIPPGQEAWVRVQAWRGLRCFVDLYIPGRGILENPVPYVLPTYFVNDPGGDAMSAYPPFEFGINCLGKRSKDYSSRVKVKVDLERLPFDPSRLFPKKCVQFIFQAEWKNQPTELTFPAFTIGQGLLRDPSHPNNLKLYQLTRKADGTWSPELICEPEPYSDPKRYGYSSLIRDKDRRGRTDLKVDFSSYWVLVSDREP